jgi:hypothetical protein
MQELLYILEQHVYNSFLLSVDDKYQTTSKRQVSFTIGKILLSYNQNEHGIERFEDFKPSKNDKEEMVFPVRSSVIDNKELQNALNSYYNRINSVASTDHIIKRIEITQSIKH